MSENQSSNHVKFQHYKSSLWRSIVDMTMQYTSSISFPDIGLDILPPRLFWIEFYFLCPLLQHAPQPTLHELFELFDLLVDQVPQYNLPVVLQLHGNKAHPE